MDLRNFRNTSRANIEEVIAQVLAEARPGDHLLCMSNGGFGGIHAKLLAALKS